MTAEPSMGWMDFRACMRTSATALTDSNCPMVFILPDGKKVRFDDIGVSLVPIEIKRGDTVCPSYEYHIELMKKGVNDAKCRTCGKVISGIEYSRHLGQCEECCSKSISDNDEEETK